MACVWKGLIRSLNLGISPIDLFNHIQENNIATPDIKCNGKVLTDLAQQENIKHIELLTVEDVKNGYMCSACDPLFFLIGHLYNISIEHNFMGTKIVYANTNSKKKIYLRSNDHHMWVDKDKNRSEKKRIKQEKKKRIKRENN